MHALKRVLLIGAVATLAACDQPYPRFDAGDEECWEGEVDVCEFGNEEQVIVSAETTGGITASSYHGHELFTQSEPVDVICYDSDADRFGIVGRFDRLPENREDERWVIGIVDNNTDKELPPASFVPASALSDPIETLEHLETELEERFGDSDTSCTLPYITVSTTRHIELLRNY